MSSPWDLLSLFGLIAPHAAPGVVGDGGRQFLMPEKLDGSLVELLGGHPTGSPLTVSSLRSGIKPGSALCFHQARFAIGVVGVDECRMSSAWPLLGPWVLPLLPKEPTTELPGGPLLG